MSMSALFPEGYTVMYNGGQYTVETVTDFSELVFLGLIRPSDTLSILEPMIEQFESIFEIVHKGPMKGISAPMTYINCMNILRMVGLGVLFAKRQLGLMWFSNGNCQRLLKNWLRFSGPVRLFQLILDKRPLTHAEMRTYVWWFTCLMESFDGMPRQILNEWAPFLRDFFNMHFQTIGHVYRELHKASYTPKMPSRCLLRFGLRLDFIASSFRNESDAKLSNMRDMLVKYGYLDCCKTEFCGNFQRWQTLPLSIGFEDERYIDIVGDSGYFSEWLYDYFSCFRQGVQRFSEQFPVVPIAYFGLPLQTLLETKKHQSKPWFKDLQRIVRECPIWLLTMMLSYSAEFIMKRPTIDVTPSEIGAWMFFYKYGVVVDFLSLGAFMARAIYQKIDKATCGGFGHLMNTSFWNGIVVPQSHSAALYAGLRKFNQISGVKLSFEKFKQGLTQWGFPNVQAMMPLVTSVDANIVFTCAWCDSEMAGNGYVLCPTCKLTMYCSDKCCKEGSEKHKRLCPIIRDISDSNLGKSNAVFRTPDITLEDLAGELSNFVHYMHQVIKGVTGCEGDSFIQTDNPKFPQLLFPKRCEYPSQIKPKAKTDDAQKPPKKAAPPQAEKPESQTATTTKSLKQQKAVPASSSSIDVTPSTAPTPSINSSKKEEEVRKEESSSTGLFKCASCGKNEASMLCGRCFKEHYCNRDCQKAHWKIHKPSCKV